MTDLKGQFVSVIFVVLTMAAVICAGINFQQQLRFKLPEDGVTWVDRANRIEALHVERDSPAENAGIRVGDVLVRINGMRIDNAIEVTQVLVRLGTYNSMEYLFRRHGVEAKAKVIIGEAVPDSARFYQYIIGIAYLAIGLFVHFRRLDAPKARHFYILCLVSFILCCFHYTGKLNNFDKVIYWGNVAAGLLAPTIFLHFCMNFPEGRHWLRAKWKVVLLYAPAISMLMIFAGFTSGVIRTAAPLIEMRWLLDRCWLAYLALAYLAGAGVLAVQYRGADDPIVRNQLKWLRNGAILGVLPFTLFYVAPYLVGVVPGALMRMSVLTLILVPLTWAYAILRYRLMDVDIIFQQGYVYTLATLSVLGIFYSLIFSLGRLDELPSSAVVTLIFVATFVFQPIRNWIQVLLDRHFFYRDQYDYRRTLIEFARELSSETDIDHMLESVADRLVRTLGIQHVSFFLLDENRGGFQPGRSFGKRLRPLGDHLDLSFLSSAGAQPYLFFERTRHQIDIVSRDWTPSVRQTIAELDLTYFLACTARAKTIAYLGLSRTVRGDFLSSDDLELVMTLSGYVGIAIENARLYRSLERKVAEYERLKEFSENIVESVNVGILAADLEDRVESWNSQAERLTGIARDFAVGRCLADLFPADLCEQFDRVRGETGIHNVYKYVLEPRILSMTASANGNGAVHTNGGGNPVAVPVPVPVEAVNSQVIINLAIAPLISKDGDKIGRLIIFDDITDRSQLERQLIQADKLSSIGLLAAGVAHEVNTPLAVISTYAQMLAKQISGDDPKSKLLEKIAKQTFRASEIVNSLLNFSRTSPTAFVEVDLNRIIHETVTLVEHQLQKAGVSVAEQLNLDLPAVKGNPGKLQQVFLNLFLNARDAMAGGGVLTVRSWGGDDLANVEVADTGQGIPAEHLARIYDPFFTTKMARKGTGLGLSVTYGIVKEHGGHIEVQSQPGTGTRFRLEFPLSRKPVNA